MVRYFRVVVAWFFCMSFVCVACAQDAIPASPSLEEPEPTLPYSFPVSSIVIPSGFGLEPGQWGFGLAGWDCHWGEDNCENDGSVMFAYGLGDQAKGIGVTLQFQILSINPQDGGFANKGAVVFKLSHFFTESRTAVAFGFYQLAGWEGSDNTGFFHTCYFSLTPFMRFHEPVEEDYRYPFSFTVGVGNRSFGQTNWVSIDDLPYDKWLPYFGVGYRVNHWCDVIVDEYSDGIVSAGLSLKPIQKLPVRLFIGGYDVFVAEDGQERTSFLFALTGG